MLNPFFQQGSRNEQNLIQDLINEQIKIYGIDVYYIPRRFITSKTVMKEVIESEFRNAYPIEAYVDTYDGYNGLGTLMSKFGIQELDDLIITISKERFETYISPLIRNIPDIELSTRPKEGDLIYFPLGDRIFEIKYVEHEKPFYQLQKNYVYQLTCELFRYEDEFISTGIGDIDDNVQDAGYIQTLSLIGPPVQATAISGIYDGGVRRVIVKNRGSNYTSIPRVSFSSAPTGGETAVGVASMISGIVDCQGTPSDKVQSVGLINCGYGYTVAPKVSFIGGGGNGAVAVSEIGDGIVGIITITNGGSGYATQPTIEVVDVADQYSKSTLDNNTDTCDNDRIKCDLDSPFAFIEASVEAVLENGSITSIKIIDAGEGYKHPPLIRISSPNISGIGTFIANEKVTGSISGTTAIVKSWDIVNNILKVSRISGKFVVGENIVGTASSASRQLMSLQEFNTTDSYSENFDIENEADQIIDFSEKNPFGTP